jgi:antitoxin YefM
MMAVKSMDVRDNFKTLCDRVFQGETLIVSRPKNENIVMLSEKEYNDLQKAKRNAEYQKKLDESFKQLEEGKTISFSMDELIAMESDDWKPTQKVLDFMEQMNNE